MSLACEAHYVQKGTSLRANGAVPANNPQGYNDTVYTCFPRLDYLSFRLFGKFEIDAKVIHPYGFAGPQFDVVVGKQEDGPPGLYDDFKSIDSGATLGAGLAIPLPAVTTLLIEFRYSHGFIEGYRSNSRTVKNESFELLCGVML